MVQAKQMLNEVGVNPLQTGEEEGWKWRELLAIHTITHASLYYKTSGQAVLKKDVERPLLLSPDFSPRLYYNDGYVDKMTA